MNRFKLGERVVVYGADDATRYLATGQKNPYRLIGNIKRIRSDGVVHVEIENSGSQDSEGHNAIVKYHYKQLRKIKAKP
jgi:hypothetical protein